MKKIAYIAPSTNIVNVEINQLLNISNPTSTNVDGLGVSDDEYTEEGRSRRTVWDDEEEEEDF